MAKVKSLVNLVLMSIVTTVRFTMKELEPFNRVASIGGGLIGYGSPNFLNCSASRVCAFSAQ